MDIADKTILVVDDSELDREMIESVLTRVGVGKILMARDGVEGVRTARFYKPDLVLLDLQMPHVDGYETCKKIRLFASDINMPIIVITGNKEEEDLQRVLQLGANDYFQKPIDVLDVTKRVKFYLEYADTLKKLSTLEKRIQMELRIAQAIQEKTLPCAEAVSKEVEQYGLDFYAYHKSSTGLGGDLWSSHQLKDGNTVFVLCDVSGHGVNAAINGSFIASTINATFELFRDLSAEQFDPSIFIDKLNFILAAHMKAGTFCAAACLIYNRHNRTVRYAGCALPDLVLADMKTGEREFYPCRGIPLGIVADDFMPTTGEIGLKSDQVLLCLSDGLIEGVRMKETDMNAPVGEQMPGEVLLGECIRDLSKKSSFAVSSRECIDEIVTTFTENMDKEGDKDDITIFALQSL